MTSFVLVMAKAPIPGRAKTRLCPPCDPASAASVARAALADTLDTVARCGAGRKVLALDGPVGDWMPPGFEVIVQRGKALADRLASAWTDTGVGVGIQIGMDTPQVTASELDSLLEVAASKAVLGPAADGGWWVIGLPAKRPKPGAIFGGVPMSASDTGEIQAVRLGSLGLEVQWAVERRDIDTFEDLLAVAEGIPDSRTATAANGILAALATRHRWTSADSTVAAAGVARR